MQNKGALALGGVGGAIALAAQTKREDAMSNLSTWLPSLEGVPNADLIATIIGFVLVVIAIYLYFRPDPKISEQSEGPVAPKTSGSYSPINYGDGVTYNFYLLASEASLPSVLPEAGLVGAFRKSGHPPPFTASLQPPSRWEYDGGFIQYRGDGPKGTLIRNVEARAEAIFSKTGEGRMRTVFTVTGGGRIGRMNLKNIKAEGDQFFLNEGNIDSLDMDGIEFNQTKPNKKEDGDSHE